LLQPQALIHSTKGDKMNRKMNRAPLRLQAIAIAALSALYFTNSAYAVSIETEDPELKMRLDTTVKYSLAYRTASPAASYAANPDFDDGNRNFRKGPISNRLDVYSEFDVSKNGLGLRLSVAGWYDAAYMGKNDNTSFAGYNAVTSSLNRFSRDVRKLHGSKVEILDGFVFANKQIGDIPFNLKLGQFAQLMGESLFFADNGVAAANAPTDIAKAVQVPSLQAKDVVIPVKQILIQLQPAENISITGYYQFEWKPNRSPAPGSFFGGADIGPGSTGGDAFYAFSAPAGSGIPPTQLISPLKPKNSGQFGLALKFRPQSLAADFGAYAAQYHSRDVLPTSGVPFYINAAPISGPPGFIPKNVQFVYGQKIKVFGVSANTNIGDTNVGFEMSMRRNTPLASTLLLNFGNGDNDATPLYAVGNSVHAQINAIHVFGPSPVWSSAALVGEIAAHQRTGVTRNAAALDTSQNKSSWAWRFLFEPQYLQVSSGLDIGIPISVGYVPRGKSSVVTDFGGGFNKGGTVSIGLNATFQNKHKFGFNYVHFIGKDALGVNGANPPIMDRDNISFYFQTSF
jgi:Protein of unknown function (DUF1302)